MVIIYENVHSVLLIGDRKCCLLSRVSSVNIIVYSCAAGNVFPFTPVANNCNNSPQNRWSPVPLEMREQTEAGKGYAEHHLLCVGLLAN